MSDRDRRRVLDRSRSSAALAAAIVRRFSTPDDRDTAGLWCISGAPGMGKSHHLDAVVAAVGGAAEVRRAGADELTGRVPLTVVDALLRRTSAQPPAPGAMADALAELDALCARGPVLLVVDDAHLVDQESLAFLHHAADASADLPLVILYARRPFPKRRRLQVLESLGGSSSIDLAPLTDAEMAVLVEDEAGSPPDDRLHRLLRSVGGNPFHARMLLSDLRRRGVLVRTVSARGVVQVDIQSESDHVEIATSMSAALRVHVDLLDRPARAVADTVAVWGGPVAVADVASVRRASVVTVVEDAQLAVDSGVLRWSSASTLEFHHDLYRDIVYSLLSDPVRRILHAACAESLRAAGAPATDVARHAALSAEYGQHYPGDEPPSRTVVATGRAAALARSGALVEASRVAAEALRSAVDPQQRGALRAVQISALVGAARVSDALSAVDETLGSALPPDRRTWLLALRRWLVLLDGRGPLADVVPGGVTASTSATDLVEIGVRACLQGRCTVGIDILDRVVESAAEMGEVGGDGATAPIWPVWARLVAEGPAAAQAWLDDNRRHDDASVDWLDPYHGFVASGVAFCAGRWDDAAAGWDVSLQAAARHGAGWISLAVGPRAVLDVLRGDVEAASARVAAWDDDPKPHQFGLPDVDAARAAIAGARGDHAAAAHLHRTAWAGAVGSGRLIWATLHGIDAARSAALAGDTEFVDVIERDLEVLVRRGCPRSIPVLSVVRAVRRGRPGLALEAADVFDASGDVVSALLAREEAACIAAAAGDRDAARGTAGTVMALARELGATTLARRLSTRLRRNGIRLGVTGPRSRPTVGWDSLTPTERSIADLVAAGNSGPAIAARLHISPRTVQTHVSHILAKLGLRTRVEIAAAAGGRAPRPSHAYPGRHEQPIR